MMLYMSIWPVIIGVYRLAYGAINAMEMDQTFMPTALKKKQNLDPPFAGSASAVKADTLAKAFVSLIPHMMGSLRRHLRTAEGGDLRVGQFRMMMAIAMAPNLSMSNAAEVMGLTLPSASKVADELQRSGFVQRTEDSQDRRRALLSLTPAGIEVLHTVQRAAEEHFAAIFQPLTPMERGFLLCAAETLRPLFRPTAGSRGHACKAIDPTGTLEQ
jgi:DNA-binding MarR family transcriptional regulator